LIVSGRFLKLGCTLIYVNALHDWYQAAALIRSFPSFIPVMPLPSHRSLLLDVLRPGIEFMLIEIPVDKILALLQI
jgi:hypothetical protein